MFLSFLKFVKVQDFLSLLTFLTITRLERIERFELERLNTFRRCESSVTLSTTMYCYCNLVKHSHVGITQPLLSNIERKVFTVKNTFIYEYLQADNFRHLGYYFYNIWEEYYIFNSCYSRNWQNYPKTLIPNQSTNNWEVATHW